MSDYLRKEVEICDHRVFLKTIDKCERHLDKCNGS